MRRWVHCGSYCFSVDADWLIIWHSNTWIARKLALSFASVSALDECERQRKFCPRFSSCEKTVGAKFDCVCLKGFKMEKGFRGLVCKGIHVYIYIYRSIFHWENQFKRNQGLLKNAEWLKKIGNGTLSNFSILIWLTNKIVSNRNVCLDPCPSWH